MKNNTRLILTIIVIAQFFCTSLWFAGNAIVADLAKDFELNEAALGHITSAVQFGFIVGTLSYAALMIADRSSPSVVFFISAVLGAISNLGILISKPEIDSLLLFRFLTGFFLAGIYPVGMKIASDHFDEGLGKALGFLVGALVTGTALPHLLKNLTAILPWKTVLMITSGLSLLGGTLILLLVPKGPYLKKAQALHLKAVFNIFRNKPFRSAAFGYFGHMWELYAFWAFVPVLLNTYKEWHTDENINVPVLSFIIIAFGGVACILSGFLSKIYGVKKTAFTALFLSGCCCLLSPLAFYFSLIPFLAFLIFWGLVVIADSPLFSTLVAQNAPVQIKGTAITIVTCIGFSLTIVSIELLNYFFRYLNTQYIYLILAVGPLAGLLYIFMSKAKIEKL